MGMEAKRIGCIQRCLRGKIPQNLVVWAKYTDEKDDSSSSLSQLGGCGCHSHR